MQANQISRIAAGPYSLILRRSVHIPPDPDNLRAGIPSVCEQKLQRIRMKPVFRVPIAIRVPAPPPEHPCAEKTLRPNGICVSAHPCVPGQGLCPDQMEEQR